MVRGEERSNLSLSPSPPIPLLSPSVAQHPGKDMETAYSAEDPQGSGASPCHSSLTSGTSEAAGTLSSSSVSRASPEL